MSMLNSQVAAEKHPKPRHWTEHDASMISVLIVSKCYISTIWPYMAIYVCGGGGALAAMDGGGGWWRVAMEERRWSTIVGHFSDGFHGASKWTWTDGCKFRCQQPAIAAHVIIFHKISEIDRRPTE